MIRACLEPGLALSYELLAAAAVIRRYRYMSRSLTAFTGAVTGSNAYVALNVRPPGQNRNLTQRPQKTQRRQRADVNWFCIRLFVGFLCALCGWEEDLTQRSQRTQRRHREDVKAAILSKFCSVLSVFSSYPFNVKTAVSIEYQTPLEALTV